MEAPFGSYNVPPFGYSFMSCKLRVDTNSSGWQRTVRKVLSGIHGVYNFKMDVDGLVLVSGMIDPYVLLNKIGKAGKRAELVWLQYGECSDYLDMPPPPPAFPPPGGHPWHAYSGGYGGGRFGSGDGYGYGYGYGYGGRSGDYWNCPTRPSSYSHRPFGRLAHSFDPFCRGASSSWY